MYNLGFSNYRLIYEEDLYRSLYKNILNIWKTNGVYIKDNVEYYIDINNKLDLKKVVNNTLLITSNNEVINKLKKELIIYENTYDPIFKLIE